MKKLLITGFAPLGGGDINPSWQAVQALPKQVGDFELYKMELPTVFGEAAALVLAKAEEIGADMVLSVGQAGGRDAVTPERIAVNIRDARISDNAGNQPRGEFVAADGPAAYFATVPVEKMAQAIRDREIRATVSNSAGAYVCNDVMYTLLYRYAGTAVRTGFIHVPRLPDQKEPNLPLDQTVEALSAAIGAL